MNLKNISFKHKSFKHQGYLWLAGTCLVLLAAGWLFCSLVLLPQWAAKNRAAGELQAERAKVATVERFQQAHPDPEQYLKELDQETAHLDEVLPAKENLGEAIAFVENTAKDSGVVFGALSTEKRVYEGGWTATRLIFKAGGSYADLVEFARRLDNGPRFMAVRAVDFYDRVLMPKAFVDHPVQLKAYVKKEIMPKVGGMVKEYFDRGIETKPTFVVMKVYLEVATKGKLPGAETAPAVKQAANKTPAKS
jgi:type IV pilus assembly protein PilO